MSPVDLAVVCFFGTIITVLLAGISYRLGTIASDLSQIRSLLRWRATQEQGDRLTQQMRDRDRDRDR